MKGLIGILCTAISVASFAALPPFTVDVCVGDSTEPTMKFGVADGTAVTHPMPPFSGMFGVKDFYIDGGVMKTGHVPVLAYDENTGEYWEMWPHKRRLQQRVQPTRQPTAPRQQAKP